MKREKREPFMPTAAELRRAEDFLKALKAWPDVVSRLWPLAFGAYAVGIIVLFLVALELASS